ncbi:phosphotransferase [Microbacteriaceae bacterium 4G12]
MAEAWAFERAAQDAGVAMPRPVPTRTGECLADVELSGTGEPVPVRVHEWVDAVPCPPGPVDPAVARAVGTDLAGIHALGRRPGREDVFPVSDRAGIDAWPELVERVTARDRSLGRRAQAVSGSVARIGDLYHAARADPATTVMSHGDVDQKNLLLAPSGPLLCDWDVASPWRPSAELLRTALALATWERPAVARTTISAYRGAGGADAAAHPEDLALDLLIGVDWLAFCLQRATGLRDASPQRRAEGRRQAEADLADLPRRVEIALSVDAWLRG